MSWEVLVYALIIFASLMAIYTFWNACTDFLYLAVRNWHYSVFILTCLGVGAFMGLYNARLSSMDQYLAVFSKPKESTIITQIESCKEFVEAKLEHRPDYQDPKPPLAHTIKIKARSYWDSCAHTFGTNYWKHDISVNGENGGQAFCRAYHESSYRSGHVDTWCDTVFLSGEKT